MRKKNAIGLILILPKSAAFHCGSIISILFANMCFYRERYSNKLSKDSLSQIDCRQIDGRFANQVFTKSHIPLFVCGNNATLEERHVIYVYSLLSVINSNLKLAKKSMLLATVRRTSKSTDRPTVQRFLYRPVPGTACTKLL